MSLKLEPGRVCEENTILAAVMNDYQVRVKNFERKVVEEELK